MLRLLSNCQLVVVSGSQNFGFPAFLTSALPPKAVIRLIGW